MPTVRIIRRANRPHFEAQWTDEITGRIRRKALKTTDRREAERQAAKLEISLAAGEVRDQISWPRAVELYRTEIYPTLAPGSRLKIDTTIHFVSRLIDPARLVGLGENQLVQIVSDLRANHRTEATIRGHLRNLRALLRWAVRRRLLNRMPSLPTLGRANPKARGRAVTAEEFDRMLAVVPAVVGPTVAAQWTQILEALWVSGLRLGEALSLSWDPSAPFSIDLGDPARGVYPVFQIAAFAEKGRKDRSLPMTPDAAALFRALAERSTERPTGRVLQPLSRDGRSRLTPPTVSRLITAIGKAARVLVSAPGSKPKYASAHDLRRAFGLRWSRTVRASLLMKLMRHESINTTLTYYLISDAQADASELFRDAADRSTNSGTISPIPSASELPHGSVHTEKQA